MTQSGRWLAARRAELSRREWGAALLLSLGLVLTALALGLLLARLGWYRRAPLSVLASWVLVVGALSGGMLLIRLRRRGDGARRLAATVERAGGLRSGTLVGVALDAPSGSPALAGLADARMADWLTRHGAEALRASRRERTRAIGLGSVVALAGAVLFTAAGPAAGPSADFWRPLSVLGRGRGPVTISVDRAALRRGERATLTIAAPGRQAAVLWLRAPGEAWGPLPLALDSAGQVSYVLGPLESERYARAISGGRESRMLHITVSLPALLSDLQLLAKFPSYLERADEPIVPGPDSVLLPVGTVIETSGSATVPMIRAAWHEARTEVPLKLSATGFAGRLVVRHSGRWTLLLTPQGNVAWEEPSPEVNIVAVPDSAPVIAIPVPGADTTAPLSLRQPLVIDVRDDHRVTRVELVSRRISRLGLRGDAETQELELPAGGTDRAVLQWILDLNGRGFLTGDTARYSVRAYDNAPEAHRTESREYVLRLPTAGEVREALREASRSVAAAADSLVKTQQDLSQRTEELASERERAAVPRQPESGVTPGDLPFRSAQRASEMGDRQQAIMDRARELRDELRQLSEAAKNAGMTDSEWQQQLKELEQLLDKAVTPEMEQQLQALRDALKNLDPEALREALKQLAQAGKQLKENLARSRELFERAAIEGAMSTLAQDAQELAQRQQEWNRAAKANADSTLSRAEASLSQETDSLNARLEQLAQALAERGASSDSVQAAGHEVGQAAQHMRDAAAAMGTARRDQAQSSGQKAQQQLDPVAGKLRQERDAMRAEWRQEVVQALDHALTETAELAEQQMALSERMNRGDASPDVRGEQAALREGADKILQRLQSAAGKNALVSPRIGTALGFAKLRMTDALDRLTRANPNPTEAGELAGQAVDGLNAMAHALLQSRGEVQGAESGSGLQEAVQKLAQLAQQQQALNGQSGGLLPMMPLGGQGLLQDLRALAEQQRRLAGELDRLGAQGQATGADQMAEEAREIARRLEAGQLDRRTVERQERLFRRLLDAGRTLRGDEEDDKKERTSQTAKPDNVRLPPALDPGALHQGPRYPYPTWEQLQGLSPDDRRLILDYFRRLNEGRP